MRRFLIRAGLLAIVWGVFAVVGRAPIAQELPRIACSDAVTPGERAVCGDRPVTMLAYGAYRPAYTLEFLHPSRDSLSQIWWVLIDRVMMPREQQHDDVVNAKLQDIWDSTAEFHEQVRWGTQDQTGDAENSVTQRSPYDGSIRGLIPYLQLVSFSQNLPWGGLEIPCAYAELAPELWEAVGDRNSPTIECQSEAYPIPDSVTAYEDAASKYDANYLSACGGTLAPYYGLFKSIRDSKRRSTPKLFVMGSYPDRDVRIRPYDTPLEAWSYHGLWNRHEFLRLKPMFEKARADLATMYREPRYGLTAAEAELAATNVLWAGSFDAWWLRGGKGVIDPVRKAILDGAPVADVRKAMEGPAPVITRYMEWSDPQSDIQGNAGDADSPLMISVERPEVVAMLIELGANVNERNTFGKTPLMMAAQYDSPAVVRLLLASGADPKASTDDPNKIQDNDPREDSICPGLYAIANGQRTALMYAAANASLEAIQLLVDAGSDERAVDSKGKTALDYLLGNGPVPANPKLGANDLERAKSLLGAH